jgi:hypothetical protein
VAWIVARAGGAKDTKMADFLLKYGGAGDGAAVDVPDQVHAAFGKLARKTSEKG